MANTSAGVFQGGAIFELAFLNNAQPPPTVLLPLLVPWLVSGHHVMVNGRVMVIEQRKERNQCHCQ